MVHIGRIREPLRVTLVEVTEVVDDIRVVNQPLLVALEVHAVNLVKAHQGREYPHVGKRHSVTGQVAPRRQNLFQSARFWRVRMHVSE